jgi:hypothetical protein
MDVGFIGSIACAFARKMQAEFNNNIRLERGVLVAMEQFFGRPSD